MPSGTDNGFSRCAAQSRGAARDHESPTRYLHVRYPV
jgi:hypothetical protein